MNTQEVFEGGAPETYSLPTLAEEFRTNPIKIFRAAEEAELPMIEYLESITDPTEREQNELLTAETLLWYLCGVDCHDTGYMNANQLNRLGDMTDPNFDRTPQGKLLWNIIDFDFMWSLIRGSENDEINRQEHDRMFSNIVNRVNEDGTQGGPMALGTLTPGEPWNDYQELQREMQDNWGPSIDYREIVGSVRTTAKKRIQRTYRDMSFENAQMMRTAEGVRHMIVEIGLEKEDFGLSGHGIQMRASYDYLSNPDLAVRDFRFEAERIGIAMRMSLFNEIVDFILTQADVWGVTGVSADSTGPYGSLQSITTEKWLQWRKLWTRFSPDVVLGDVETITKWEKVVLGTGTSYTTDRGIQALIDSANRGRNSLQLNNGTRIPRYGWIDETFSKDLYGKFTDSTDEKLGSATSDSNTALKYLLFFNRSTASRLWFRRQSRQDESGRDTQARFLYRDLHAEWGVDRPIKKPETAESNIIRTNVT